MTDQSYLKTFVICTIATLLTISYMFGRLDGMDMADQLRNQGFETARSYEC